MTSPTAMTSTIATALSKMVPNSRPFLFTCVITLSFFYLISYLLDSSLLRHARLSPVYPSVGASTNDNPSASTARHRLSLLTADSPMSLAVPAAHDVCLFLSPDPRSPRVWGSNSRSLCVTSPLCLPTHTNAEPILLTSNFSETSCRMVAPDYHPLPPALHDLDLYDSEFLSCPEAQRHMQLCPLPNGTHHLGQFPPCLPSDRASNQWVDAVMRDAIEQEAIFDGITIIVPFYPYPANIYHFSAAIATVSHVASNIDTIISHFGPDRIRPVDARDALPLNILFTRRRRKDIPWANNLERALFEGRIASALPKGTKVSYLTDLASAGSKYACVRNPISMGQRGHVNAWPFANSSEINLDGSQVPRDSIGFRSDVYKYVGVDEPPMHLLNEREADSEKANQTFGKIVGRVPVPPLVLGYSKRQGMNSTVGSGVHVAGTVRRFSEDDEEWFTEMLTYETKKVGVALKVFTPSPEEPFDLQVRRMVDVGFVVGIHGANLVNSLFMRPFGAFFEIFPANMKSMCYKAGANSGLKYLKHYAVVEATPEESGCDTSNHRCFQITRQRMVKISTEKDREGIRQNVRSGLRHIIQLNNDYSSQGGVPVTYNWVTGTYDIADWKR